MISNESPTSELSADPAPTPKIKGPAEMPRYRVRVRFSKSGPLRFISHNDLLRLWDRMLRRTGLPLKSSEGFHTKTRLSSPLSLAVGIEGREEIIDLEFTRACSAEEVADLLAKEVPAGLGIVSVHVLSNAEARMLVTLVEYTCDFGDDFSKSEIEGRIQSLLAGSSWVVCRRAPGKPDKQVDIRPYIDNIVATPTGLVVRLHVHAGATARPEEVLEALGIGGARREGRCAVTRSRVILGQRSNPTKSSATHGEAAVRKES